MAKGDVSAYFQFFDKLNADIAAREDEKKVEFEFGADQHQVERDKKYREKWGQPRARPRPRARPIGARIIRGSMENPGAATDKD